MTHSDFERIAAYYNKHMPQTASEMTVLFILNTQNCSAGICRVDRNGIISELGAVASDNGKSVYDIWKTTIMERYHLTDAEAQQLLSSDETDISLWNYYSSGGYNDEVVFSSAETEVTLRALNETFGPARTVLTETLDKVLEIIRSEDIDERSLHIIAVGELSYNAAVQIVLREQFTFDPIASRLSDKRFKDISDWGSLDLVLSEGENVFKAQENSMIDVSICNLYNPSGDDTELHLLVSGQKILKREEAVFSPPIFVTQSDATIDFRTSGGTFKERVPEQLLHNGEGLIEVASVQEGDRPVFLFRNATDSKNVIGRIPETFINQKV